MVLKGLYDSVIKSALVKTSILASTAAKNANLHRFAASLATHRAVPSSRSSSRSFPSMCSISNVHAQSLSRAPVSGRSSATTSYRIDRSLAPSNSVMLQTTRHEQAHDAQYLTAQAITKEANVGTSTGVQATPPTTCSISIKPSTVYFHPYQSLHHPRVKGDDILDARSREEWKAEEGAAFIR